MTKKAEQREATVRALIQIGREFFTRDGYAETATEALVQQAGVTRGALYHHFGSKEGLFRAVLETVQAEVAQRIILAASQTDDLWQQLLNGCRAFLEASTDPGVRRIMLINAPAVLGWEVWRQIDAESSMQTLQSIVAQLMAAGIIHPLPADALVHLLSGAMNEAALWIATSDQPEQALAEATTTLEHLLESLRK